MKILIAGATGAIGRPLIPLLKEKNHTIYAITQSEQKAQNLLKQGVTPVVIDVLNPEAVYSIFEQIQPNVVIDMLTKLPKEYTPESMKNAAEMDAIIRTVGGSYLQAAAEAHHTSRYISQSCGFFYEPGSGLADENTPFALKASPGIAMGCQIYQDLEERVQNGNIEGVSLRFGFFYGPGTWFHRKGDIDDQMQKKEFPLIGEGQGLWNFIHIEDAAKAIVSSLDCTPSVYNIVNDQPISAKEWMNAFARYVNAPQPPHISEEQGLSKRGPDAVYYATKLRGASNEKAKKEFKFNPRPLEWL